MQPGISPQAISDTDGVNLLIEMSDGAVRQKVGQAFVNQMGDSEHVRSTFFSDPNVGIDASWWYPPLPPEHNDWVGQVASSLIALSLAQCSSHGFSATVDKGKAQAFLNANLSPSNANFTDLAMSNYEDLFPTYCAARNTTFDTFHSGGLGDVARWGTLLADRLSSTAYINQQMIKLNPAVDPGGWYQVLFANIYKVQRLMTKDNPWNVYPAEVERVRDAWDKQLHGKQLPTKDNPWTVYDHMVASNYSYSTFLRTVQDAINTTTRDSYIVSALGIPRTQWNTYYGAAVNDWLRSNLGLGGFIKGVTTMNMRSG